MTDQYASDGGPNCNQSQPRQQVTYEIDDDELPSEAVIRAVAAVTDTSVIGLKPLYDVVDPDHLDGMLEETETTVSTELSFRYHGCNVSVIHDEVQVCEGGGDD